MKITLENEKSWHVGDCIDITRIIELDSPALSPSSRKRKSPEKLDPSPATRRSSPALKKPRIDLGDILDTGSRLAKSLGWRRRELAVNGVKKKSLTKDEQKLLLEDYRELMASIHAEENLGVISRLHAQRNAKNGRFA